MRPRLWQPPVSLSPQEAAIVRRIQRAKLFIFLREQRHELFSVDFQEELARALYADTPKGQPPIPPAQLALATMLQAYNGVSDDEVIEATTMDRRWQLVLDCLDGDEPPFSKATSLPSGAAHRHDFDRRLIERTLEVAQAQGGFSPRALRAALDSSPLWGAGRVEDTVNLLGHALRKALSVMARQQGRGLAEVAAEAGAALVGGPTSLKATLDLDWDDPAALPQALRAVLEALAAVEAWLDGPRAPAAAADPVVAASREAAEQVRDPGCRAGGRWDASAAAWGQPRPAHQCGGCADAPWTQEPAGAHGWLQAPCAAGSGLGLVCAVGLTSANAPEASVTTALDADLAAQHLGVADLAELHIDRAYLSSRWVRDPPGHAGRSTAKPGRCATAATASPRRRSRSTGTGRSCAARTRSTCPSPWAAPSTSPPPAARPVRCARSAPPAPWPQRPHPSRRAAPRGVAGPPADPAGRAKLRERVAVEHTLAHVGHWQGRRARYRGQRKNLFDLRRCAVVHNLHVMARLEALSQAA